MQLGTEVILKMEYKGYPAGTPLISLGESRDSGYLVLLSVVVDDVYHEWLKSQQVPDMAAYVKRCVDRHGMNEANIQARLEFELPILKPLQRDVMSLQDLDKHIVFAQKKLQELEAIRTNYLLHDRTRSSAALG